MQRKPCSLPRAQKVFAYFLNDHHGDGIVSVCAKVLPGDNAALIAAQPARFYLPGYIGPKGWVALRLDRAAIDWKEVAELVAGSYELTTPKRLAAKLRGTASNHSANEKPKILIVFS
jgi:hypothetical protein